MRITRVLVQSFPLKTNLRNALFDFREMTTSIVAVESDVVRDGKPVTGYAFNSFGRYSCEEPIRNRFAGRIVNADPASLLDESGTNLDPAKVHACFLQRERRAGYGERSIAAGTLDVAVWDLVAKIAGKPLHRLLAERHNGGRVQQRVFCYVGGGWYFPGQTTAHLQDEMRGNRDAGYDTVKMKIGGLPLEEDCRRIEAILSVMGDGSHLAVDATCAFDRERGIAYGKAIAPYRLRWYEEPCEALDFETYRAIVESYGQPMAAGENLCCVRDVENFLLYSGFRGGRDILQVDPPLAFGITEFLKIVALAERRGFPRSAIYPHGGNMMGLHVVGGLGLGGCESYPEVFGDFSGFSDDVTIANGHASLPDTPGIGFERQPALHALMRQVTA